MSEHIKRTVETEFTAKDAGYSAGLGKIMAAFESGWKKLEHGREKLNEFRREQGMTTLAALGLGVGIGAWVEKIKEANTEFASAKKSIAGVLSSTLAFDKGTSEVDRYRKSFVLAGEVVEKAEATAARFDMSLQDTSAVYRSLALSAGQFGLGQEQVSELMESTAATAKHFGVSGEQAADGIARALKTGTVKGVDEFSLSLSHAIGNMHKLSQAQRFDHIRKALKGSMAVADEMSTGIGASLNRARLAVEGLIRTGTGPLFAEISKSISDWSKHIREATGTAKPLVEIFADKLVTAFHTLRDVSKFISEHWKSIAAVYASFRAKELLGGVAESLGGMGASLGGRAGGFAAGVGGALGQMAGKILPVVGALAAFKLALDGVVDLVNSKIAKSMDDSRKASGVAGTFGIVQKLGNLGVLDESQQRIARKQVDELRAAGLVRNGKIDKDNLLDVLHSMDYEHRKSLVEGLGIQHPWMPQLQVPNQLDFMADDLAKRFGPFVEKFFAPLVSPGDKEVKFQKQVNNFYGGIHVTQKFEEADPDRVFVRFQQGVEAEASRRTQSAVAEPEGF